MRPLLSQRQVRTGLTLAGILLLAAGTQVIPAVSLPTVEVTRVATMLPGVPFETRIRANLDRVVATVTGADTEHAEAYQKILDAGRQLLHFDPAANRSRGSWAELVGTIDERTRAVGILVPGSAAFVLDNNFDKYYQRATHLVEQAEGALAMVVWAGGTFPKGWVQGSMTRYQAPLGRALAMFSHELQLELKRELGPDADVRVVVVGHSFGGAVVGAAERYGLTADAVLHVASAGVGAAQDPYDYPEPERPRFSLTAPGDLIGFVQGLPSLPGLGAGPDPDEFRCVTTLPAGRLPSNPGATDEDGKPLGDRAGDLIEGISSHSDVFIRFSDAWWEIYRVLLGEVTAPPECPAPRDPEPIRVRILPLAVPRVVTDSQCRAGGGLRPGRRHRQAA
jgi:pimeloyl-ACP methyl ester carboxylesterase